MSRLEWGNPEDRSFETGLDRGVVYIDGQVAAWNGLMDVEHAGTSEAKQFFIDGVQYLTFAHAKTWSGKLRAINYPEIFNRAIGNEEVADGVMIDGQIQSGFDLSYRTMVGTSEIGKAPAYKIHIFYGVYATISDYTYQTLSDDSDPTEFEFDLSATPKLITGYRPSAHMTVDTRKIEAKKIRALEDILYGTSTSEPSLPTPNFLMEFLKFDNTVIVEDNGDGTWTASGSRDNIKLQSGGRFTINNAPILSQTGGVYQLQAE